MGVDERTISRVNEVCPHSVTNAYRHDFVAVSESQLIQELSAAGVCDFKAATGGSDELRIIAGPEWLRVGD